MSLTFDLYLAFIATTQNTATAHLMVLNPEGKCLSNIYLAFQGIYPLEEQCRLT